MLGKAYEFHVIERRREKGIYYTPKFITKFIVENTVGTLFDNVLRNIEAALQEQDLERVKKLIKRFFEIRIFDPACGSGNFLTIALKVAWNKYNKINEIIPNTLETFSNIKDHQKLIIKILLRHIYGNDTDKNALEIAKLNLWLEIISLSPGDFHYEVLTSEKNQIFPNLDLNLTNGNFLSDTFISKSQNDCGYDVIIGNPPYVPWNTIGTERKSLESGQYEGCYYECRPNHPDSQPNLYLFFLIKAVNLLNNNGKLSFILPQEWLFPRYSLAFRNYILNYTGDIYNLKFPPDYRAFRDENITGTNSLILFLNKDQGTNYFEYQLNEIDEKTIQDFLRSYKIEQICNSEIKHFNRDKNFIKKSKLNNKRWEVQSKFFQTLRNKLDHPIFKKLTNKEYFRVFGGFQPPIEISKKFCINEALRETFHQKEKEFVYRAIYRASRIQRYYLEERDVFWIVLNDKFDNIKVLREACPHIYKILDSRIKNKKKKWWEFPNVRNLEWFLKSGNKLLIARTSNHNSFALDSQNHLIKGTNSALISLKLDIKYCLGILNSKLADYYYQEYGYSYHGGTTKKYEPQKVKNYMIPIKIVPEEKQKIISNLVDELNEVISDKFKNKKGIIIKNRDRDEKIREIDQLIDIHVFKLYGLSLDEITYILEYLNTPQSIQKEIFTLYTTI
ncbi:MAG: hypothetical protein EU532_12270 [Promethearchaeota archaeon]|nr:MAG: hypothetical protein EU532_12270 [Candidatus Lokiarchaeota archaeon]